MEDDGASRRPHGKRSRSVTNRSAEQTDRESDGPSNSSTCDFLVPVSPVRPELTDFSLRELRTRLTVHADSVVAAFLLILGLINEMFYRM